jgi:hypothetical protein
MDKEALQKMYFNFLKEKGFDPRIELIDLDEDEPNDVVTICFDHQGRGYFIDMGGDDKDSFLLGCMVIVHFDCKVMNNKQKLKLYEIANETNLKIDYVKTKVLIVDKKTVTLSIGIDTMIDQITYLQKFFTRMLENVQKSVDYILEKLEANELII